MIHGTTSDLAELLRVQPDLADGWLGGHVSDARSRVYGGQFLGQGLMAALADDGAASAQSLHALYIRAGSTDTPLTYRREALCTDVAAISCEQNERRLFTMDVRHESTATQADAPAPTPAMPKVAPPEQCISREEGIKELARNTDSTWAVTDSPFDYRFVENIWANDYRAPRHHVWFRVRDRDLPAEPRLQQAALAYFSDDNIMDNALFPHGWHNCWSNLQTASLDHSLWFHAPIELNDWLLFAQDSPVAARTRGLTRGQFFRADGTLVATAYQEILMR